LEKRNGSVWRNERINGAEEPGSVMTVVELLRGVVTGAVTEVQFMEDFSELFRGGPGIPDGEAQCLSELVEYVNMAEHVGPLFDRAFVWKCEECLRLLSEGRSAPEIRSFFATSPAP